MKSDLSFWHFPSILSHTSLTLILKLCPSQEIRNGRMGGLTLSNPTLNSYLHIPFPSPLQLLLEHRPAHLPTSGSGTLLSSLLLPHPEPLPGS